MDGGAWKAAVHGVAEGRTRLSDFTFTLHFHALEKEMATHSSVLPWRIPGTGEPGGLPSIGSHRVGHNWSDSAALMPYIGSYYPLWECWRIRWFDLHYFSNSLSLTPFRTLTPTFFIKHDLIFLPKLPSIPSQLHWMTNTTKIIIQSWDQWL